MKTAILSLFTFLTVQIGYTQSENNQPCQEFEPTGILGCGASYVQQAERRMDCYLENGLFEEAKSLALYLMESVDESCDLGYGWAAKLSQVYLNEIGPAGIDAELDKSRVTISWIAGCEELEPRRNKNWTAKLIVRVDFCGRQLSILDDFKNHEFEETILEQFCNEMITVE